MGLAQILRGSNGEAEPRLTSGGKAASIASLNDFLCKAPTGFKGAGVSARAVRGHRFGLGLPAADRQALILFLKTL